MRRAIVTGRVTAALALAAVLHGGAAWSGTAKRFAVAAPLTTVDPALISSLDDERFVLACREGLTVLDGTTGEAKPGAAERWEGSPDGRTWTFHLRDASWVRKVGDAIEVVGPVKAQDFVDAWKRLLDPDTQSPHAHLLDVLPGVAGVSTAKPRAGALDRLIGALDAALGGKARKSLTAEKVHEFLDDPSIGSRRWLAEAGTPEARELLGWPLTNAPYQGAKGAKLIEGLGKVRDVSLAAANEAESHVGIDRGFFARDEKTLVVETAGAAPWLPSLLARGPLVPVNPKQLRKRDQAFTRRENFIGNGAYVSDTEVPRPTDASGERTAFKGILLKNPHWRDAASVATERIECHVNQTEDEIFRLYAAGSLPWIESGALSRDTFAGIRGAKAAGFEPKGPAQREWKTLAEGTYEVSSGSVFVLRFRCAPPLDKADARRALASLIDRRTLAGKCGRAPPPPETRRFVHPRTTGALGNVRLPAFDAAKATSLYGPRKFTGEASWIDLLCGTPDDHVGDAIAKVWKPPVVPDEAQITVQDPVAADGYARSIDDGRWQATVVAWRPAFDDPLAFLGAFSTGNPAGDCLWSNATYDALLAGAMDVAAFAAKPPPSVADVPSVKAALPAAKSAKGLEDLRRALLAEAEAILLDEAVVVPLWIPVDAGIANPKMRGLHLGGARPRPLLEVQPFQNLAFDE